MSITREEARRLLHNHALRATAPRVAVLRVLAASTSPLSHTEVVGRLGDMDWDPATVYRNLVKLRAAGLAPVVGRVDGIDRYAFSAFDDADHRHPHFVCDDCGRVSCLPSALTASMAIEGPWETSVQQALVQLRGACPDCLGRTSDRA